MPTTTIDGVDIAYDVTGDGPPLVLLHGITESRRMWDPLVPQLAEDHTVVAIDQRGHGASGLAPAYDAATMAGDAAAIVSLLALPAPLMVGHSMGGVVVTAYAAAFPCAAVVNIDQPLDLGGFQEMVRSAEPALRSESYGDVVTALFDSLHGPLPDHEVARLNNQRRVEQEVLLGVWAPLLEMERAALDELVRSLVAAVTVPYLSLHGGDPGPDYAQWLESVMPSSTFEVWEDHGHYPHLVAPDRFLARLRAFEDSLT